VDRLGYPEYLTDAQIIDAETLRTRGHYSRKEAIKIVISPKRRVTWEQKHGK